MERKRIVKIARKYAMPSRSTATCDGLRDMTEHLKTGRTLRRPFALLETHSKEPSRSINLAPFYELGGMTCKQLKPGRNNI